MKPEECSLFSGAANGAESAFGGAAERWLIQSTLDETEATLPTRPGA
jgi:hypothetical protein